MTHTQTPKYEYLFKEANRKNIVSSIGNRAGYTAIATDETNLASWKIEKTTPGKMFGFATSQMLTVEMIGPAARDIVIGDKIYIRTAITKSVAAGEMGIASWVSPVFFIESYDYDEVTNRSTLVAYDIVYQASKVLYTQVTQPTYPATMSQFVQSVVAAIDASYEVIFEGADSVLNQAPNFTSEDNLATVLAQIAEASGSICVATSTYTSGASFIQIGSKIRFRPVDSEYVDEITPDLYMELSLGREEILSNIVHQTELGDNGFYGNPGYTQVMRENAFLSLAEGETLDILMTGIANKTIGITASDFHIKWKGTPLYEPGDKIRIHRVDGTYRDVIVYDEILTYNGGLSSTLSFTLNESEDWQARPATIAGTVRQTSAKVDKVNNEITLMSRVEDSLTQQLSELKINADIISAEVTATQQDVTNLVNSMEAQIDTLTKKVGLAITSDNLAINVQKTLSDGVTAVNTTTGFTFDEIGLTIDKTGSEMSTTITEDGMKVFREGEAVLIANNVGVEAINLYATTFLTIGTNSRMENYEGNRTACFWIGE